MLRTFVVRGSVVTGCALAMVIGAHSLAADDSKNAGDLEGSWVLVSGEEHGKELTEKELKMGKLKIEGDHYHVTVPGKDSVTGTQKLDPTKDPKTIDITDAAGPNKGKTCLGIYEVEGDEFKVVFAQAGKPRPTKFEVEESGQWMHVWKRAK